MQCKHTSLRASRLALSDLADEVTKAKKLVEQGLCDTYLLLTNAAMTARAAADIRTSLTAVGVRHVGIYGASWLEDVILGSSRLRALIPRLYGLGDLSEILDERSYEQARVVLESLKESLSKFVITRPYDESIAALNEHGFVLLLGEPAAGKTTIASALAMAAVDQWGARVIKADRPSDVRERWNPHAEHQFFWVDDAFGVTQYQLDLVQEWNRLMPVLQAAIGRGARVVFTSRDYIYRSARDDLKQGAFPLLAEAQVVIRVQNLPTEDKEQILYNHLRLGSQTAEFRKLIKPHLATVAASRRFLPEVARRLGDPVFTRGLTVDSDSVRRFVDHPLDFMLATLRGLDVDHRAALALIYNSGGERPSPLQLSAEDDAMLALFGAHRARCAAALTAMDGSLVSRVEKDDQVFWMFRHPTIGDALARLVVENPELLDIYLKGSSIYALTREVTCGSVNLEGVVVIVPTSRFDQMISRLDELEETFSRPARDTFLLARCSDDFLRRFAELRPQIADSLLTPWYGSWSVVQLSLIDRLNRLGLVTATRRSAFAKELRETAVALGDLTYLKQAAARSILADEEIDDIKQDVRARLEDMLPDLIEQFRVSYDPGDDVESHLGPLYDTLETYKEEFADDDVAVALLEQAILDADDLLSELPDLEPDVERDDLDLDTAGSSYPGDDDDDDDTKRSIFDDVDR